MYDRWWHRGSAASLGGYIRVDLPVDRQQEQMELMMARYKAADLSRIGNTIRSVAQAQSSRFFKSDHNNVQRSAFVFVCIQAEIYVALYDAGVSQSRITSGEIDPTDDILRVMEKDGYVLDDAQDVELAPIVG
jgi:hypothetical protein